jgi:hypothetical protein
LIVQSIFPGALFISAGGVKVSRPTRKYHFGISTVVDASVMVITKKRQIFEKLL